MNGTGFAATTHFRQYERGDSLSGDQITERARHMLKTAFQIETTQRDVPLDHCKCRFRRKRIGARRAHTEDDPELSKKWNRLSSGCGPVVVAQHSSEALSALNRVTG